MLNVIGTPVGFTLAAAVTVTLPVPMVNWFPVTETLAAAVTVTVPEDESNRHYQEIQEWAKIEGNNIIDPGA